jgi:hypothetical protein
MTGMLIPVPHVTCPAIKNCLAVSSLKKVTNSWIVKGIGEKRLYVKGVGDVFFKTHTGDESFTGILKNVLYVPDLGINLVSIGAATEKENVQILFLEDEVLFSKNGRLSIKGKKAANGLYRLDISVIPELEFNALISSQKIPLATWHQRLGHVASKTVQTMASRNIVEGLNLDDTPTSILCSGCLYGKMHRRSFPKGKKRAKRVGELIHADLCGPMQIMSPGGMRYFMTCKDDASCYTELYFLHSKDEANSKFKGLTANLRSRLNRGVEILRTDGGGEWTSKEFELWLQGEGIVHHTTAPYTPEKNGVAERYNRTLMESARCMLYAKSVPLSLWAEAVHHANYVLNRTLTKGNDVTPYEAYFNVKPDVSNLFIFGSKVYYHVPKELRRKLDAKCKVGIVVGICDTTKAFRIWDFEDKRIRISRDVCIDESAEPVGEFSSSTDITTFEKFEEIMLEKETIQQMELDNKKEESIPALSINTPLDHQYSQQDNPQSNETGGAFEISQPISTEVEEKIPEEQLVSISNLSNHNVYCNTIVRLLTYSFQ